MPGIGPGMVGCEVRALPLGNTVPQSLQNLAFHVFKQYNFAQQKQPYYQNQCNHKVLMSPLLSKVSLPTIDPY